MTEQLQNLIHWLKIMLVITSVCTTIFPLLWAFSPWYRTVVGRLLMAQSVCFCVAIDLTTYTTFRPPPPEHIVRYFWIEVVLFTAIAVTSLMLTYTMIRMNYFRRKKARQDDNS